MSDLTPPDSAHLSPLRSVHTSSFPELLSALNVSVAVSTYQASRLVLLRPADGTLNTHFRAFDKPMGVATDRSRIAIGTAMDITEFHNIPAVGARSDPERPNDACFLPRNSHSTGDIQIHEMEWGTENLASDGRTLDDEPSVAISGSKTLWFVNTRFSCLCTRSSEHSFTPRWRPRFISAYTPEDRCHLNGLGMVDGRPKFATALGESDEPAGWRKNKRTGGILMDVPSGEIIARGLSMPHSPRWHDEKLWVLNSGDGGIGIVDESSGRYEQVAKLQGFTRGLSFLGRYAFVGLSQVRESAIFSGIRIAQRPEEERWSGVAVVDTVAGEVVAWMRFEDQIQEVFAVSLLPGMLWPDVVNDDEELISSTWVLPDEALQEVPASWRAKTGSHSVESSEEQPFK